MSLTENSIEDTLFEKHRGQRRWLGKEHHKGKEMLNDKFKNQILIRKTIGSFDPISKKQLNKIKNESNDDYDVNVLYSMNKKNRWEHDKHIEFLKSVPEGVNAEVVERNLMSNWPPLPESSYVYAVHSKINENIEGDFEVRTATSSSAHGQDYSNFLPESRELSKKKGKKSTTEVKSEADNGPTVTYNIFKTHRSVDVVGKSLSNSKSMKKPGGKQRGNKDISVEIYDDLDEFSDEEQEQQDYEQCRATMADFVIEKQKGQVKKTTIVPSETSFDDFEIIEEDPYFDELLDLSTILNKNGYTFIEASVQFSNLKDFDMKKEIEKVIEYSVYEVKQLNENSVMIDATKWCNLSGNFENGESTIIVYVHKMTKNNCWIVVNSTVATHPNKQSENDLMNLISSSGSLLEALSRIIQDVIIKQKTLRALKQNSSFFQPRPFSELWKDSDAWKDQSLTNQLLAEALPNKNEYKQWTNSVDVSVQGAKQEWKHVCEMVKETYSLEQSEIENNEYCLICKRKFDSFGLYGTRCKQCLKNEFYREFRAKRFPINLKIETTGTVSEFDLLPSLIPLPLFNTYTRMVFEIIYRDLGAIGNFEVCPSCSSTLFFESDVSKFDISCPCGHTWCSECESAPHWPMTCNEFKEWNQKWNKRYSLQISQGEGNDQLYQIACRCHQSVFYVRTPAEQVSCPKCKFVIDLGNMTSYSAHSYVPWYPRWRKVIVQHYNYNAMDLKEANRYRQTYEPAYISTVPINKIPALKKSVEEVCGEARTLRLDEKAHKKLRLHEHELRRQFKIEEGTLSNLIGSALYFVENVTAWMNISNKFDKNIRKLLENVMEARNNLMKTVEREDCDKTNIEESMSTLQGFINDVKKAVACQKSKDQQVS